MTGQPGRARRWRAAVPFVFAAAAVLVLVAGRNAVPAREREPANTAIAAGATRLDLLSADSVPPRFDKYNGIVISGRARRGRNVFAVQKAGNRWLFVTPEGNPLWMLAVFAVEGGGSPDDLGESYDTRLFRKYKSRQTWAEQSVKRLRTWGFNALGEYASLYALPVPAPHGGGWSNPQKLPFVALIRPSLYGLNDRFQYSGGAIKDLIAGADAGVYKGWRGATVPDVFDPKFERQVQGWMQAIDPDLLKSPWLVGIATDDLDELFGFGPGPEVAAPRLHPHIAWLVLAGNYEQTQNARLGVRYADTKVYAKYALREFLQRRYASLEKLNSAWNAAYTTWDSDGGWPRGRGFLDESGRGKWVGNDDGKLSTASHAVRADLDDFLYEYAKQYFSVTARQIRRFAPDRLVFGPASFNGWGGLTRRQILKAAGESVDVIQASLANDRVLQLTSRYAGDVPIVTWEGFPANADSSLWRYRNPADLVAAASQPERARIYAERATFLFHGTNEAGVRPVAGLKFWAFGDSWGEKTNWGLVSFLDNAYDGKEAIRADSEDRWGFPAGGEERDYGDLLSTVTRTNESLVRELNKELVETGRTSDGPPRSGR